MYELCLSHVRADRTMRAAIGKQLESYQLTMMEWLALGVVLAEPKDGVSMTQIAETLDVTLPQVTALVGNLLKLKLIKQKTLARDRRGRQVTLTLKGRRTLRKLEDTISHTMQRWSEDIPENQLQTYVMTVMQLGR
ncbi:MAG TPA: MarR family transcriptional regulator [Candidatus Saccharimonadales bacterium]|nr:MarR family transcriptional regulator [Candidatus Saccharimonadales bacterium]